MDDKDPFAGLAHDLEQDSGELGHAHDFRGHFGNAHDALAYILAGRATVTLVSKKTQTRFTYRITIADDGNCHFVGLLSGPDNQADYRYIGRIARGVFWIGRKVPRPGDLSRDTPSVKAFDWSYRQLVRGILPEQLEIWHEGSCGRCGRALTVPDSIARGLGPICSSKLGGM